MATPREIREVAFLLLFQLDAQGEAGALDPGDAELSEKDLLKAEALARAAYEHREGADEAVGRLAPSWPVHRQPPVDRAILRLACYELAAGLAPASVVINEAVELAKRYSTERSPAFVNAVLDRIEKGDEREVEAPAPMEGSA